MKRKADCVIRIGVIGCGRWGKNYVRHFSSMPGVQLAAVADLNPANLESVGRMNPQARVFRRHSDLLAAGGCDAVVVATTASTHYPIIRDSLERGLDVLAEKPFTLKVEHAESLVRAADRKKRILMVAHTFLFNPSIVQLKQYIADGVLGDIYYAKARRTHLGLIREDVNAVWDLAPHDVSMLLYLLGEKPSSIQAMGRRILRADREDVAFVNLSFPSGVMAHIHVSWADSNKERYLDIVGSKSRIVFDDLNLQEPIRIFYKGIAVEPTEETTFGEFKYLLRDGDILSPKIAMQEPLKILCESFINSLRTRKKSLSDGAFGRDVVEVLCRIEQALKRRR